MSFSDDLDRQRAQVMRAVRQAAEGWATAMRAHKMAPPDVDFASRLGQLSQAAAAEAVAWEHANAAGLHWRPVPGAANAAPPYELRPGTGRRGPKGPRVMAPLRLWLDGIRPDRPILGSPAALLRFPR